MFKKPKKKDLPDRFRNKQTFFEDLKKLDPAAIRHLSERLTYAMNFLNGIYLLSKEDIEELRNDAILITLQKLVDGSFIFQDYDPLAYARSVAHKLLANRLRKQRLPTAPLDGQDSASDLDPERYYLQKETETAIGRLLRELGKNCEQIIRLKYYDNLRDQEVVDEGLAPYTTVDSLKNKRSQCLKKLAALVKEQGWSFIQLLK